MAYLTLLLAIALAILNTFSLLLSKAMHVSCLHDKKVDTTAHGLAVACTDRVFMLMLVHLKAKINELEEKMRL